ncbi:ATP-dependent DNA helicase sgs1 [Puccinia graminis f. sp. tritici]|uniref:ATP-dependent DNA helicase sgs1 n=1 Tax=Puccinia graminis f. sp. tritici TaxID=56615 RepID=A0A5B0P4A2_PUCGR|nr:ATP-dependent DNA helicase sgs1 [Puccinia graminis f. sp. tritici]KAA1094948.1 ATP-dependent DNA helicase sgs1 [Puccinia graminis f. sp. tritici]
MSVDPTAEETVLPFEDESHCEDNPLPGSNSSLVGDTTEDQDSSSFGDITEDLLPFEEISDCRPDTPLEKSGRAIKNKPGQLTLGKDTLNMSREKLIEMLKQRSKMVYGGQEPKQIQLDIYDL